MGKDVSGKVVAALRDHEGATAALGIFLEGCGPGWATASLVLTPAMTNGFGSAHGGVLFTLADTAFAWACNSANVATVAQAANISFLSPGEIGERVVAAARHVASTGRSGVYDVTITGGDGRVIATFQGLARSLGRPVLEIETGDFLNG